MNPEAALAVIGIGLKVLSKHALVFLALIMTFGVYVWALWAGSWIAAATAAGFGVTIFLPILWRSMRKGDADGQAQ